ncbi:hypothetical protein [Pseudoalteromonas maricaloris]|nr:hypothetical protein [Pseudoalteromonas flavipulchra]
MIKQLDKNEVQKVNGGIFLEAAVAVVAAHYGLKAGRWVYNNYIK